MPTDTPTPDAVAQRLTKAQQRRLKRMPADEWMHYDHRCWCDAYLLDRQEPGLIEQAEASVHLRLSQFGTEVRAALVAMEAGDGK